MSFLRSFLLMSLVVLAALVPASASGQLFMFDNPLVDKPAPDFKLNMLSGKEESLAQLRNGMPAIVFFWATWCPHCREQLKELNAKAEDLKQKGIKVILMDIGEDKAQVQHYVDKNKISFDIFLDEDSKIADDYGIVGVPTLFFVNKEGIIKAVEFSLPENFEALLLGQGKKG